MLRSVAVVVRAEGTPQELGVACEVFGIDRRDTGGPAFDFTICGVEPGVVKTKDAGHFSIVVEHGLEATRDVDLVIVPAYGSSGPVPEAVLDALRDAHASGAWVLSICSGSFALGQAGLLDGRQCTTHWMYTEEMSRTFPQAPATQPSSTSTTTG